jgi:hypothetical protein
MPQMFDCIPQSKWHYSDEKNMEIECKTLFAKYLEYVASHLKIST